MKLVVLGDTNGTSQRFAKQALHSGYQVVVVLNQPATPPDEHHNLTTVIGAPHSKDSMTEALDGAHAVVDLTGTIHNAKTVDTIASCMDKKGLQRLVIMTDGLRHRKQTAFEATIARLLQKTPLDWTMIHLLSRTETTPVDVGHTVTAHDFTKFMISQITEVDNLRSTITLTA